MAGCKCPGSCACKIKKPRKPKVKKAVVGGRVRQPQVVIQGMPAVSQTAIPQGYPFLTVTSDAAAKRSMTTQTETQAKSLAKVRSPEEIAAIAKEQKEAGIAEGYRMGRRREAYRQKEIKENETKEPILVNVAKGAKEDIFTLVKQAEATGKIFSLTGAGRPKREFSESIALATPPAPAPVVEPRRTTDFEKMKSFFQKKHK